MNLIKTAILAGTFVSLFACRARQQSSMTRAVETTSLKGRVAVFDVYDKDKRLTRQALGVLVSARGVLMSGLRADETVVLADAQRRGEKYIPLQAAKGSVAFIGLEAQAQALVPTTAQAVPPLSSQLMKPLELSPRITKDTQVIMYNELGYVLARATMEDGKIKIAGIRHPRPYPDGGVYSMYFDYEADRWIEGSARLSEETAEKMLRKGGAIISAESSYDGIISHENGWSFTLKNSTQTATVDILAFVAADREYKVPAVPKDVYPSFPNFTREDLLPQAVQSAVESTAVKNNLPRDVEREMLKYLGCY